MLLMVMNYDAVASLLILLIIELMILDDVIGVNCTMYSYIVHSLFMPFF